MERIFCEVMKYWLALCNKLAQQMFSFHWQGLDTLAEACPRVADIVPSPVEPYHSTFPYNTYLSNASNSFHLDVAKLQESQVPGKHNYSDADFEFQ